MSVVDRMARFCFKILLLQAGPAQQLGVPWELVRNAESQDPKLTAEDLHLNNILVLPVPTEV